MTFNADVGKWLRNVTSQTHRQVHQGITGLATKESSSAKRQPPHKSQDFYASAVVLKGLRFLEGPQMANAEKRKWREALPKITISGDDSWQINSPGLPKMARMVMMRDRQRHKNTEKRQDETSVHNEREQSPRLSKKLCSEDFYNACLELEASGPQSHPSVGKNHESGYDDDLKEFSLDLAVLDSKTEELNEDSRDRRLKPCSHLTSREDDQKGPSEDMEEGFSSEDDEEMRQWRQELSILNKEISQTSESLISKGS